MKKKEIIRLFDEGHGITEIEARTFAHRDVIIQILRQEVRLPPIICSKCRKSLVTHLRCNICEILLHKELCHHGE